MNNKREEGKMEKVYIGTKIIAAEPMDELSFVSEIKHEIIEPGRPSRLGYKVRYEDGYVSWSPKETFERAYRALNPFELSLVVNSEQDIFSGNDQEPVKEGPK